MIENPRLGKLELPDQVAVQPEESYRQIEYRGEDDLLTYLRKENEFLRGVIKDLVSKINIEKPLDPQNFAKTRKALVLDDLPHEITEPSEARSYLEDHFKGLADAKK